MGPEDRESLALAFSTLATQLQKHHDFSEEDLKSLIKKEPTIPATAFNSNLTPIETLVRLLNKDEVKLLQRPSATILNALKNSKRKQPEELNISKTKYHIPIRLFADKNLAPLEHICLHLKKKYHLRNKEISEIIGKDQRTVWTAVNRAKQKGGENNE